MYYFSIKASHLGDYWSRMMHALVYAQLHDESTLVVPANEVERHTICKQIYDLVDFDKKWNYLYDVNKTVNFKYTTFSSKLSYNCIYFPTKQKWKANKSKKICYSFDANYEKDKKTPPDIEESIKIKEIDEYQKVRVGLPMDLYQVVKELSECEFLVTLDNGIAHVARSVGCPIILVQHTFSVARGFPPGSCEYNLSAGTQDTINHIKNFVK
jgi:hypothetical protein